VTLGERDLLAFRRDYYDLLVSLLWREPPGQFLATLRAGIGPLSGAARPVHRLLGDGWREIEGFFTGIPAARRSSTFAVVASFAAPVESMMSFTSTPRAFASSGPVASASTSIFSIAQGPSVTSAESSLSPEE